MTAEQIKRILAETASHRLGGYRAESRLWKIHDLRAAGLDYQTARFVVENPDMIEWAFESSGQNHMGEPR